MSSIVVFGVDWTAFFATINWLLVLYVILSVIAVVIGSHKLYPSGMGAATIFAIGSTLVLVFFGYRWFSGSKASKVWPPSINMCPDYLTFVPNVRAASSVSGGGCVDLLGVSRGGLLTSSPSDVTAMPNSATASNKLFEYTAKDVSAATDAAKLQIICNRCQAAGVTWEGVFDGDSCVAINKVDATNASRAACLANV